MNVLEAETMSGQLCYKLCVYIPIYFYMLITITKEPLDLCTLITNTATIDSEIRMRMHKSNKWMSKPRKHQIRDGQNKCWNLGKKLMMVGREREEFFAGNE